MPKSHSKEILGFLDRFHADSDIDSVFTSGCCFWFAAILFIRFKQCGAEIVYDSVVNHFGTRIDGRVYDITGDVTSLYSFEPWADIRDESLRRRIIRDCIMF